MAKILFTHSYFYQFDPKQWRMKQPYPPLGTLFAAALMRQQGHQVSVFDTNLRTSPDEIVPFLISENPEYLVIYDDGFNYLTKMCLTNMREAAFRLSELGKKYGATVIVCSSDASDHYEKYLDHGADYVILGEGEITLKELITSLKNETSPVEVQGLAFRNEGKVTPTAHREVMKDLDQLPDPAWDLVDLNEYRKIWVDHHGYFSLNIATTRGCPFKCNWCAKPIYGNRYNSRSPERVAAEIEMLINTYKPDHFWICDDIFGLKPGWVQQFRDEVKARNLSIKYKIQSRVDLLLKQDTSDALVESGLDTVWVGAESGSQKVLDAMDKGTTVEQIYEATELMRSKGVKVAFFLQFGYLGETKQDIQKTIDMVLDLMPDEIGISVSYPLPGTGFYDKVKRDLVEKANWTDSDDLDLMYEGTYKPEYYKKLHRYVHATYRSKKGINTLKEILKTRSISNGKLKKALGTAYYLPTSYFHGRRLKNLESV